MSAVWCVIIPESTAASWYANICVFSFAGDITVQYSMSFNLHRLEALINGGVHKKSIIKSQLNFSTSNTLASSNQGYW